ncbi:hypothetical protein JTE90_028427 [Oedothorax gibbosus]|uniref:Uncharacterized protein n=1 Tax=Oedothorax gibbosus TaxID=931172 RepID=A0AAV6VGS7_9ARAC|nr:hypothetical protein JTE90_028427 [Oedothorax gibbosus]
MRRTQMKGKIHDVNSDKVTVASSGGLASKLFDFFFLGKINKDHSRAGDELLLGRSGDRIENAFEIKDDKDVRK